MIIKGFAKDILPLKLISVAKTVSNSTSSNSKKSSSFCSNIVYNLPCNGFDGQ